MVAQSTPSAFSAREAGIVPAMLRSPRRGLRRAGLLLPSLFVLLPYIIVVVYIGGFFELSVEVVGILLAAGPVLAAIAYFVYLAAHDTALKRQVLATALIAPGQIDSIVTNRASSGSDLISTLESLTGQRTRLGAINLTVAFGFTVASLGRRFHGEAIVSTADASSWKEGDECVVVYDPVDPERNFIVAPRTT